MNEFELIQHYFRDRALARGDVVLGIGDDAAVLSVPADRELVVAIDAMVAGVHFPHDSDPRAIGHKLLAVNLSDLAAMGAEPAWATLALVLPEADAAFLEGFAAGLAGLAAEHAVALVGGDTVRAGQLTLALQAHGLVPRGEALTRAGARPGDGVWVTGTLGDAGAGLALTLGNESAASADARWLRARLDFPAPRVQAGRALRGIASAAIDVSDGLMADLGHILEASGCGATLEVERLPVSGPLRGYARDGRRPADFALCSGDDYELVFTVPREREGALLGLAAGCPLTRIGRIDEEPGLRLLDAAGTPYRPEGSAYDHFRA